MKGHMNRIKLKLVFLACKMMSHYLFLFLLVVPLLACLSFTAHTMSEQCSVFHIHLLIFDHDSGSPQLFLKPFVVECAIF